MHVHRQRINESGFPGFLSSEPAQTKSSKTRILEVFLSAMGPFQFDQGNKKRTFGDQALARGKRGIDCITNVYIGFDLISPPLALPSTLSLPWSSGLAEPPFSSTWK